MSLISVQLTNFSTEPWTATGIVTNTDNSILETTAIPYEYQWQQSNVLTQPLGVPIAPEGFEWKLVPIEVLSVEKEKIEEPDLMLSPEDLMNLHFYDERG